MAASLINWVDKTVMRHTQKSILNTYPENLLVCNHITRTCADTSPTMDSRFDLSRLLQTFWFKPHFNKNLVFVTEYLTHIFKRCTLYFFIKKIAWLKTNKKYSRGDLIRNRKKHLTDSNFSLKNQVDFVPLKYFCSVLQKKIPLLFKPLQYRWVKENLSTLQIRQLTMFHLATEHCTINSIKTIYEDFSSIFLIQNYYRSSCVPIVS